MGGSGERVFQAEGMSVSWIRQGRLTAVTPDFLIRYNFITQVMMQWD